MQLPSFDFQSRTRVVSGAGCVERLGELARELGSGRILLVTDAGLVAAGHVGRAQRNLEAAGLHVTLFDRAKENPATSCVDDCVAVAKAASVDTLVGLGGGSSMDTAKGCNFIFTNGGRMQEYRGVGKATKPMLPFIAIPTTAGTGSEMQSAALIADEVTHEKMACLDLKCAARIAILDPELTLSQPLRVTACTGIDAIAHAVETAVTTKRNPLSQRLSAEAFRLCVLAFPEVLRHPQSLNSRVWMQVGAALAGAAIEQSMLGAAHAAANPLTAHHGIAHGHAVGLMLPHVVQFNACDPAIARAYGELACAAQLTQPDNGLAMAVDRLSSRLQSLLELGGLRRSLGDCGVKLVDLPRLAVEAAGQWTARFNPRVMTPTDFERIYTAALA